ncbi:hypothetical protein BDZ89DRAFT_1150257 [Hymenopellis radicata]|nr:hypothetical protein BDZ89DRAFT_1150257 [Hymenopellis radicata]
MSAFNGRADDTENAKGLIYRAALTAVSFDSLLFPGTTTTMTPTTTHGHDSLPNHQCDC